MAVEDCWDMRTASVLVPRSNRKESKGVRAFPVALIMNAIC